MQNEKSRVKIHTTVQPPGPIRLAEPVQEKSGQEEAKKAERPVRASRSFGRMGAHRVREERERLSMGERLVRNTALACALLLTVMALKNVDQPWSRQATEGIRRAMTMRVDWDETLGKLSFVRALVPETALVFFSMGETKDLSAPAIGEIYHAYSADQPWLEYRCAAGEKVCAAAGGVVSAAGKGAGNDWTVLIENEEGVQTVYGYLSEICVERGETVAAGQQIGTAAAQEGSRVYFELRENGAPVDPTGRFR